MKMMKKHKSTSENSENQSRDRKEAVKNSNLKNQSRDRKGAVKSNCFYFYEYIFRGPNSIKFFAVAVPVSLFLVFCVGCGILIPSAHETKIPAEFKLTDYKGRKTLVLVNQPAWLGAPLVLRQQLTERINDYLVENVKLGPNDIIDYEQLSDFRAKRVDYNMMTEAQIGRALGADLVLLVVLDGFNMAKLPDVDYYNGELGCQAILIDVESAKKLWPQEETARLIKVGFDFEVRGQELAINRLASAAAYCITKYLYDCRKDKFKIADDRSGAQWQQW
jgi:hypothetical protein